MCQQKDDKLAIFLAMLIAHVERWRLFTIDSDSHETIQGVIGKLYKLHVPNLEFFCVALEGNSERLTVNHTPAKRLIFTGGAPRLSHFECPHWEI